MPINFRQVLLSIATTVLLMSITFVAILNLDWKPFETATILLSISMAILSLVTIAFTFLSIKSQKQQWLNDMFVKYESEKLLEMRRLLDESNDALSFLIDIFKPKKYAFIVREVPKLKRLDFVKSFNQVIKINELYNANQHIYRKHNLEVYIESIILLLDATHYLPKKDLIYIESDRTDEIYTWLLEDWKNICLMFNNSAHIALDTPKNGEYFEESELNEFLRKDQATERERLLAKIQEHINELLFKLDLLTLYLGDNKKNNLNIRKFKFYKNLE